MGEAKPSACRRPIGSTPRKTGDVILSRKPTTWDGFFSALQVADVPQDFLSDAERAQGTNDRDPLEGWRE